MDPFCPHLGMLDDSSTCARYPTSTHACHRIDPPVPLILEQQSRTCLKPSFVDCPGYIDGWNQGFPDELRGDPTIGNNKSRLKKLLMLLIGGLLVVVMIGILLRVSAKAGPKNVVTIVGGLNPYTPTETSAPSLTHTRLPTLTNTPEPSPTLTETPTEPPTQTPGPGLQTPFGSETLTFAVHLVTQGQTLFQIAELYGTTTDVLQFINQFGPQNRTVLWEGDILVICVNCATVSGLPVLQAVFLESGMSVNDLADTFTTSIDHLRLWNGLGEGEWVEGPRWMIVAIEN